MMGLWRSAGGLVAIRLTSSDVHALLQIFAQRGIVLYGIQQPDPLTLEFVAQRKDFQFISNIVEKRGDNAEILQRQGLFWRIKSLLHRPLLLAAALLIFLLSVILPNKVMFVEVEGNCKVPSALIEEKAAQCGIQFWASRAEVRSEKVKNRLLESIPQLQWVGVNTAGCRVTISVRERSEEKTEQESYSVSRIVACRDGIVSTIVATAGTPLCVPGQAVRMGQTLITGFTDCGLSIRAERAAGEVFAFTNRQISAVFPVAHVKKSDVTRRGCKISLLIGKNRINLWKDSGISCTGCVKIYEEKWVCLPGGFRLPVCLVVEHRNCSAEAEAMIHGGSETLKTFARRYLLSQMLSGSILNSKEEITEEEACLVLTGQYECLEMIGRERGEETLHGKTD